MRWRKGAAGSSATELQSPSSVSLHGSVDLVIADASNNRVQVCSLASPGTPCTTVGGLDGYGQGSGQVAYPRDVAVDGDGNYVIVDRDNHRL